MTNIGVIWYSKRCVIMYSNTLDYGAQIHY